MEPTRGVTEVMMYSNRIAKRKCNIFHHKAFKANFTQGKADLGQKMRGGYVGTGRRQRWDRTDGLLDQCR